MPKLNELTPGTRFRLPHCGKTGVLKRVGESGASVLYDGARKQVEFTAEEIDGEKRVAFESPGQAVVISGEAVVEVL